MSAPFTIEQLLGVFVAYNATIWRAQIAAYIFGLVAVAVVWSRRPIASRLIPSVLAPMWALNGSGYQFLFFATIKLAAKLFAGFFFLKAILFAASAVVANALRFQIVRNFRSIAGATVIIYAMLTYPVLGIWAGHGLMAGPMFGVAPCPTTIFTIGMLMLARGRWVVWLSIIPFLWSLVGLAAAVQLGMSEDLGLPIAGVALMLMLATGMFQLRPSGGTTGTAVASADA